MLKGFTIQRLCCYRHATNYRCFSAIKCNELRLLLCVVTGMQRITNASARSRAMNYRCWLILKGFTIQRLCCYRHATNYGCFSAIQWMNYRCWCAIVQSEKTHTVACNAFRQRDPVQWITAADLYLKDLQFSDCVVTGIQRITDASARSSAMNYGCCCVLLQACNELRMLQRDPVPWITAADAPSCSQKKHTRWPATHSGCCCLFVPSQTGYGILV